MLAPQLDSPFFRPKLEASLVSNALPFAPPIIPHRPPARPPKLAAAADSLYFSLIFLEPTVPRQLCVLSGWRLAARPFGRLPACLRRPRPTRPTGRVGHAHRGQEVGAASERRGRENVSLVCSLVYKRAGCAKSRAARTWRPVSSLILCARPFARLPSTSWDARIRVAPASRVYR